jgi:hypothetical protein
MPQTIDNSLSLWKLESDLVDLMNMRDEAETDDQRQLIDQQIRLYLNAEIRKVDCIRAYWKHCEMLRDAAKAEAAAMQQRAANWGAKLDRLKAGIQSVMEAMPWTEGKPKKLEGLAGALLLKANGGKQAVTITDPQLIPDEYCVMEGRIPMFVWNAILHIVNGSATHAELARDMANCRGLVRVPSASMIASALEAKCLLCNGDGWTAAISDAMTCPTCGGSGKQGVPGARLEPRGQHVEMR